VVIYSCVQKESMLRCTRNFILNKKVLFNEALLPGAYDDLLTGTTKSRGKYKTKLEMLKNRQSIRRDIYKNKNGSFTVE
jgi:hypothetical protein